ncbi:MAG: nucleotidyltransferase substrate binding protein [Candidatus Margulisiibacteriota bacterium]
MNPVRWKQRYSNLLKAYEQLSNAVKRDHLDELETAGLIQMFEFTFELA